MEPPCARDNSAVFDYDPETNTYAPDKKGTVTYGFTCHTRVAKKGLYLYGIWDALSLKSAYETLSHVNPRAVTDRGSVPHARLKSPPFGGSRHAESASRSSSATLSCEIERGYTQPRPRGQLNER
jgi:hypothetical protein